MFRNLDVLREEKTPAGKVHSPWPGPMLPRSAVRKAAAGQRPALRALDNRARRPEQRQQFRAHPRIRRPRRAERQAGRRAVPEAGPAGPGSAAGPCPAPSRTRSRAACR
jgi:hypothetical protein